MSKDKEGTYYDAIKEETEHFSFVQSEIFLLTKEGISVVINSDIRETLYQKIWGYERI